MGLVHRKTGKFKPTLTQLKDKSLSRNTICIICFWDRTATPYLEKYERTLSKFGVGFDVLFWDRGNSIDKSTKSNEKYIKLRIAKNRVLKLLSFLVWGRIVQRIVKQGGYKHLIILSTYPGILLRQLLRKQYKGQYIFDIRDYSMENCRFFRLMVMDVIESSSFTAISSPAYMQWLEPSSKILLNHNITGTCVDISRSIVFKRNEPIVISFVGTIRLDDHSRAFMLRLKNNERYIMEFVGRMTPECDIQSFCLKNGIQNVKFQGAFTNDQKPEIYKRVDLINSVYANIKAADTTPLPNRLYDSAIYKVPIICSLGTYLAEMVLRYGMGLCIDAFDPLLAEKLDTYIDTFDEKQFIRGCKEFIKDVMQEEDIFLTKLKETLIDWESKI